MNPRDRPWTLGRPQILSSKPGKAAEADPQPAGNHRRQAVCKSLTKDKITEGIQTQGLCRLCRLDSRVARGRGDTQQQQILNMFTNARSILTPHTRRTTRAGHSWALAAALEIRAPNPWQETPPSVNAARNRHPCLEAHHTKQSLQLSTALQEWLIRADCF